MVEFQDEQESFCEYLLGPEEEVVDGERVAEFVLLALYGQKDLEVLY